jgi:hypothetical protein
MRALWTRRYTGEGLWGRGALLSTGEFERNTAELGEPLPEHLCGGTYRSRGRKRKAKKTLTFKEQKERRILKKFGANGVTLGEDAEVKRKLEKGKMTASKPRVAGSARGRELRAAAALARFEQQQQMKTEEVKVEAEEGSETDSGDDYEEDDATSGPDAVDLDGKKLLDSKGRGMIKICEDENPDDLEAQQELRELQSFGSKRPADKVPELSEKRAAKTTQEKQQTLTGQLSTKPKVAIPQPLTPEAHPPAKAEHTADSDTCPVCTYVNEPSSTTCAMCASVLDPDSTAGSWACTSRTCEGTEYRNAGDCGVCGVCGERRPASTVN